MSSEIETHLVDALKRNVATLKGQDVIDLDAPLTNLGVDSITVLVLYTELAGALGIDLGRLGDSLTPPETARGIVKTLAELV